MKTNRYLFLAPILLYLIIVGSYLIILSPAIENYLKSDDDTFFASFAETIYPQLITEKHQFDSGFFFSRIHHILIRTGIFSLLISIVLFYQKKLIHQWNNFWDTTFQPKAISVYLYIYHLFIVYTLIDWLIDMPTVTNLKIFFNPIFPLKLFLSSMPSLITYQVLGTLGIISSLLSLTPISLRIKMMLSIATIIILLFFHSSFCSLGKLDHGYATVFYTGLLLPFYYAFQKNDWVIRLIQTTIVLVYFMAGLEKLTLSGINWFYPDHFSNFLLLHPNPKSEWLVSHPILCSLFSVTALTLQLSSIIVLFQSGYIKYWLLGLIAFHWGTTFFLEINSYLNPWIIALAVFLPSIFLQQEELPPSQQSLKKV